MINTTSNSANPPRRVRVVGRDEVGLVIDGGKNFGVSHNVYCVGIYFESTGEVAYYDADRVTYE